MGTWIAIKTVNSFPLVCTKRNQLIFMKISFIARVEGVTICIFLAVGMFLFFSLGRLLRKYWHLKESEPKGNIGMLHTGLFGLFGFIMAFTFGMSGTRYDNARNALIQETNSIGTAILRSDLYSDSIRKLFRKNFRDYLDGRIAAYTNLADSAFTFGVKRSTEQAGRRLWSLAMSESIRPEMMVESNQMVPALNNMFDAAAERETLLRSTIPVPIIYMLLILGLVIGFMAGFTSGSYGRADWLIITCFILFNAMIVYITLDLGRPLRGLIKARAAEHALQETKMLLSD